LGGNEDDTMMITAGELRKERKREGRKNNNSGISLQVDFDCVEEKSFTHDSVLSDSDR
jgi:hypothetical protein